tara:strand:+ start:553 stop:2307 length:1755 start_codon:yes stop_codon:yes gene_type:complete
MAALTANEILKPFYSGDLMGKERYHMIIRKMENNEPFKINKGGLEMLKFKEDISLRILKSDNPESIHNHFKGSAKPFILESDVKGVNPFGIRQLEKTAEFGGGGSSGKKIDPHELMTAALILQHGRSGGGGVPTGDYITLQKAKTSIKTLQSYARSIVYASSNRSDTIKAFTGDYSNYAKAISAANGFLRDLAPNSKVHRVHATGQQWIKILAKYFAINQHEYFGDKDYNSSDLIVEVSRQDRIKLYVGISLKKKGIRPKEKDPTIINKTVLGEGGLLTYFLGEEAKKQGVTRALNDLYLSRSTFFYNVIAAALDGEDLATQKTTMRKLNISNGEKDIPAVKSSSSMPLGSAAMKRAIAEREKKVAEKNLQNITDYLRNLKKSVSISRVAGKKVLEQAQKLGQKEAMTPALKGKWPPKKPVFNQYFFDLNNILLSPGIMKPLCIGLLNIIFKLDLRKIIKDRSRYSEEFVFTLITGSGDLTDDGIQIAPAGVIPEKNSTSFLLKQVTDPMSSFILKKPPGEKQAFEKGSNMAKLKYDLFLNGNNIAEVEIRYKGAITAEPQFQAFITSDFKRLLSAREPARSVY